MKEKLFSVKTTFRAVDRTSKTIGRMQSRLMKFYAARMAGSLVDIDKKVEREMKKVKVDVKDENGRWVKEKLFPLSPWQKEARRKVRENPNITVEDLTKWFGCNNFGYFPKTSELRAEIRKAGEK